MMSTSVQPPARQGLGGRYLTLTPHSTGIPTGLQALAERILGPISWKTASTGYAQCPGQANHSTPSGPRDCRVYIDGVPSIHCVHGSCADAIAAANHQLRSTIAKAEIAGRVAPMVSRPKPEGHQGKERLAARAQGSRKAILADERFHLSLADLWEASPVRLTGNPMDDWRTFLGGLFSPTDLIWLGDRTDSGPGHEHHFRQVTEWLKEPKPPGPLICPGVFKPGSVSRSKANIQSQPFLVLESDELIEAEQLTLIAWMRQFACLRAVVFSGRRSFHSWWTWPTPAVLAQLTAILPPLGVDPASLRPGHCSRAPSFVRPETRKRQSLFFLDL